MRATVVTFGTQGDVAPFTGIGARLLSAGFDVTFVTHECFGEELRGAGFDFRAVPGDPHRLVSSQAFRDWEGTGYTPAALVGQIGRVRAVLDDVRDLMTEVADRLPAAVPDDTDLLLLTATAEPLGYPVAEAGGLPSMGTYWGPVEPSRYLPPIMTGGRSMGRWSNLASGHISASITRNSYRHAVRRVRRQLGLAPTAATRRQQAQRSWPILHGVSSAVLPRPPDWRHGLDVVGYWWPNNGATWSPPAQLMDFLESRPAPVFVGFGSMVPGDSEQLADEAVRALRMAGSRGIVQGGWLGLEGRGDDVLTIDHVPHDWLFPRVSAVVHHAGAGTTGAAARSGVPQVPVPVAIDQPFWAARMVQLGVAPDAIPLNELTAQRLGAALCRARESRYVVRAQHVGRAVRGEDGAGRVLRHVEELLTGKGCRP